MKTYLTWRPLNAILGVLLALLGHFRVLWLRCNGLSLGARLHLRGAAGFVLVVFLCLIIAILADCICGLAWCTRHNFRLGALNILMLRGVHGPLQLAQLMSRLAEEALELQLGLSVALTLSIVLRIWDGNNFLVRHTLALLEVMLLLMLLLMINCID